MNGEQQVVLYVEDEDAAVFLLEEAFREADSKVRLFRVSDGEQALAFLKRSGSFKEAPKPVVILLDLNMPRRNGFEVLAEMRKFEGMEAVPVVVFTSSSLASDRQKSLALGAREYITKPSTFDGFVDVVRQVSSYVPGAQSAIG